MRHIFALLLCLGVSFSAFSQSNSVITAQKDNILKETTNDAIKKSILPLTTKMQGQPDTNAEPFLRRQADSYTSSFQSAQNAGQDAEVGSGFTPLFDEATLKEFSVLFKEEILTGGRLGVALCENLENAGLKATAQTQTTKTIGIWGAENGFSAQTITEADYKTLRGQAFRFKAVIDYALLRAKSQCNSVHAPFVGNGGVLPGVNPNLPQNPDQNTTQSGVNYVTQRLAPVFINALLVVVLSVSVIAYVVAGIMFVLSGVSPDQKESAKNIVQWTSVGLVLALLSFAMVRFIVGLEILQ